MSANVHGFSDVGGVPVTKALTLVLIAQTHEVTGMALCTSIVPYAGSPVRYNECVTHSRITTSDDTKMNRVYHPLLALIASATDRELAKYVEYLKHENKILRDRLPKQVHTTYEERQTLLKYGKALGRAIEELITIVSPGALGVRFLFGAVGHGQGHARLVRDGIPVFENARGHRHRIDATS